MKTENKKIKVLHLIHTLETGGAQKVIVNLIRGIDKERFEFTTVCMQKKGPIFDEIISLKSKAKQIPKKGRVDLSLVKRLRRFITDGKYDIVHSHNFSAGLWGRLAVSGIRKNKPIAIHTEHGRRFHTDIIRKSLKQYLAKRTDRIISVSDETRQYMIEKEGLPGDLIDVIHNGIDIEYLSAYKNGKVSEIDDILKENPNARFLVNVSALSEVKDHSTLLKAFKILLDKIPDTYLILVGDGSLRLALQKESIDLDISDHVVFMGERQDVAAVLDKCDLFVLSSINEGHPISLLEAMSMGIVPVTTSVGGIPELLENTVTGLMVPPGEPSLLAKALRIPLEDKDLYREISKNAQEAVLGKFTAETMAHKHEKLYLELLKKL